MIVYLTQPGEIISKSTLQQFRSNILDQDDVFQPEFLQNVLFYGSKEVDLTVNADAYEELEAWDTKRFKFAEKDSTSSVSPGPYILAGGNTWQPWRIYRDFNATFMCTFKPAPNSTGR